MRQADPKQEAMFSYVSPEERVPAKYPLRPIRAMIAEALTQMDRRFENLYSQMGRPSIAPERLIRALLQQVLYLIRSERLLVERLEYNLLFRNRRTSRHAGYALSIKARKLIEESFGWAKDIDLLRRPKVRNRKKIEFATLLTFTGYNLVRMRNLLGPGFT